MPRLPNERMACPWHAPAVGTKRGGVWCGGGLELGCRPTLTAAPPAIQAAKELSDLKARRKAENGQEQTLRTVLGRQLDLEGNRIELLWRHADPAQKWQPTWVVMKASEIGIHDDLAQPRITVLDCLVQPLKCPVGLIAAGQDTGDVVGTFLSVLVDDLSQCCIRFRCAPQVMQDHCYSA